MDYRTAIETLVAAFALDFDLTPVMGVELECYVRDRAGKALDGDALHTLTTLLQPLQLYGVVREHGEGQIELIFRERQQLWALVEAVTEARCTLASFAADCGYSLSLAPKPFADQPGNGQHVHLSLMDVHGQNVFFKRDDVISEALNFALGGLMAALPESMVFFAPSEVSYARFCGSKDAPTTISWGANNRTTALRLPESRDGFKHIEHRVPGSDASLAEIIYAILAAVHDGLTRECIPPPQTYGDAFVAHYALPLLPRSYGEAEMALRKMCYLQAYYPV